MLKDKALPVQVHDINFPDAKLFCDPIGKIIFGVDQILPAWRVMPQEKSYVDIAHRTRLARSDGSEDVCGGNKGIFRQDAHESLKVLFRYVFDGFQGCALLLVIWDTI